MAIAFCHKFILNWSLFTSAVINTSGESCLMCKVRLATPQRVRSGIGARHLSFSKVKVRWVACINKLALLERQGKSLKIEPSEIFSLFTSLNNPDFIRPQNLSNPVSKLVTLG